MDDTVLRGSIKDYVQNYSWFELDGEEDSRLDFVTRRHGDVGSEQPGQADIEEACRIRDRIQAQYPNVTVQIESVDEWVSLNVVF